MASFKKPEWHQNERNSNDFTTSVVSGVHSEPYVPKVNKGRFQKKERQGPNIEELEKELLQGNRSALARSITLIESNAEHHFRPAQELLQNLLSYSGNSIRIGITGVPGAGKSTFIEAFGTYLCDDLGLNVAVLAVDPSSSLSGGSILGDKTRMEQLSRNPKAFIRPSPSSGKLGGVHRKTRETMVLCEAAGFDVILVETVGVGQSEVIVRDMVDFFMLLVLTGAGDELQGMKKGIMELTDTVIVNKADGANKRAALKTKAEYDKILHFLQPATKGWVSRAYTCSSVNNEGIDHIWNVIEEFSDVTKKSGVFEHRRREQTKEWIYSMIIDQLQFSFFGQPEIKELLPKVENDVIAGNRTVTSAVEQLFSIYSKQ
ncbi:methylmalonyl Co-A mutase-associated GTPase MeaB [Cytobacillus horneckiae]|uniref:Methylmalonyl Co-A mutase-associated GTPase MeaB n=1 Tax=Cytobacillus horneckiae TaxID=549687 RepID=A0A2N0Z9P5_9BACI|nr:methylmalonyl Co-A mutase-associated GTPase MeaB [Cytobacillus horneckiae]MEC1155414.1 methylmalonyl Co-A mutase-associated GTPase MeaB [Cytobacillus horneckiae]MED2936534.1 methylmalonyl Co-A mutase-associated GTPase MeaB [Cytobacillus horneckiae]PKG26231.1 methylmalonyl Co-A mutase-associated GTPase MeaB [Cytobacillus horneckiae]